MHQKRKKEKERKCTSLGRVVGKSIKTCFEYIESEETEGKFDKTVFLKLKVILYVGFI